MKNNNKLTLKSLQQELAAIKAAKTSTIKTDTANAVGHDIKDSYIQKLYMKSSGIWLFLITGILGYAHRMPIVGKILTVLSLWYGKTSWWKILSKLRRIFIIFNALIGVVLVFKTTGFSTDNIFAGFAAVGYTYFEILTNFTSRLFKWFVELFDHKIVPNVPSNKPSFTKSVWTPKDYHLYNPFLSEKLDGFSLREFYKYPGISINIDTTPWYKDWSTLLWIGGSIVGI